MAEGRIITLVATFLVVVTLLVVATVVVGFGATVATDGSEAVQGQSPSQFQPEALNQSVDPETGEITLERSRDEKSILVDQRHRNRFTEEDLGPVSDAVFRAGHELNLSGGDGGDDYADTLEEHDALLVINPTRSFKPAERAAVEEFVEDGGRVVILAEPTQLRGGGGFFSSPSLESFGPTKLADDYGFHVGSETLYNMDDDDNDNNFKSIYASPTGDRPLTEGVETVTFDTAGHVVIQNRVTTDAVLRANRGTRTLETRRRGRYPTAARNGNVVFVADSNFIFANEVYDADNEVFVSNLLEFLVSGDEAPSDDDADASTEETETPEDEPTENGTTANETAASLAGQTAVAD